MTPNEFHPANEKQEMQQGTLPTVEISRHLNALIECDDNRAIEYAVKWLSDGKRVHGTLIRAVKNGALAELSECYKLLEQERLVASINAYFGSGHADGLSYTPFKLRRLRAGTTIALALLSEGASELLSWTVQAINDFSGERRVEIDDNHLVDEALQSVDQRLVAIRSTLQKVWPLKNGERAELEDLLESIAQGKSKVTWEANGDALLTTESKGVGEPVGTLHSLAVERYVDVGEFVFLNQRGQYLLELGKNCAEAVSRAARAVVEAASLKGYPGDHYSFRWSIDSVEHPLLEGESIGGAIAEAFASTFQARRNPWIKRVVICGVNSDGTTRPLQFEGSDDTMRRKVHAAVAGIRSSVRQFIEAKFASKLNAAMLERRVANELNKTIVSFLVHPGDAEDLEAAVSSLGRLESEVRVFKFAVKNVSELFLEEDDAALFRPTSESGDDTHPAWRKPSVAFVRPVERHISRRLLIDKLCHELLEKKNAVGRFRYCLHGSTGIGKTHLLSELVPRLQRSHENGAVFVSLFAGSTRRTVMQHVLSELTGESFLSASTSDNEILVEYRSALQQCQTLICIDSLDKAPSGFELDILIPPFPSSLLITSQTASDISGITNQLVPAFAPDESFALLKQAVEGRKRPVLDEQLERIAHFYRQHPGDIAKIAAAISREGYNVETLVEQLESNPYLSTVEIVYQLLANDTQQMLVDLAIFPDEFDLEAVAFITDQDKQTANELLVQLTSQNLLDVNDSTGRFRLHEQVRHFAQRRLENVK